MADDNILETRSLTKEFKGFVAVKDVALTVRRGTIHALIGPNGAGKTTFFNCITGFYHPEEGTIMFDGDEIIGLKPNQITALGIARTFQIVQPFAGLTVLENIAVGAHLHIARRAAALREATEVAKLVGLELDIFWVSVATVIGSPRRGRSSSDPQSGAIAGDSYTLDNLEYHAFRWTNGTMVDLGTLGGTLSEAYGINDSGQVVGGAYAASNYALHAFLCSGGVMQDLGALGAGRLSATCLMRLSGSPTTASTSASSTNSGTGIFFSWGMRPTWWLLSALAA